MAVTIGYIGATGRDLGYGGSNPICHQHQPDRSERRARAVFPGPNGTWNAAALREQVPNPFFGVPGAG